MASQSRPATDGELLQEETETDADANEQVQDEAQEDASRDLPLDQIFEILKNERRRTVLHYLHEQDETVSLGELAEYVAAIENDKEVPKVTSNERKCVYVGLYQCHLPKMDNMGIVEFNQNRGRISLGPNADQLDKYLGQSGESERPWPAYYGSVAVGGFALLLASSFGAAAIGLTPTVVTALVIAGIAGTAAMQVRETRDE